jgi:hypothetical protein
LSQEKSESMGWDSENPESPSGDSENLEEEVRKPSETVPESLEETGSEEEEEEEDIWGDLRRRPPIESLIEEGYTPKRKKVMNYEYIVLSKGKSDISLGRYTDRKWKYLSRLVAERPRREEKKRDLLAVNIVKPPALPTKFSPSIDTIYYYKLLQEHGYEKSFDDFLNEVVKAYFLRMGITPGIIISVREGEEE